MLLLQAAVQAVGHCAVNGTSANADVVVELNSGTVDVVVSTLEVHASSRVQ